MTTLDLDVIDTVLVVEAPAPTCLVADLDPPLVLEVAPLGAVLEVTVAQTGVLTAPAAQGPMGVQGRDGAPGATGPAGPPATSFVFYQPQPASEWAIAHNLGRYPSVTVVDTAGSVIDTTVTYVDANNVLVDFTPPAAGYAYLN